MSIKRKLWKVHERHIRRTQSDSSVASIIIYIAQIPEEVGRVIGCSQRQVRLHTRMLKHLYDKKPAEEFDFMMDHMEMIVQDPDELYRNKDNKTGNFCLVKNIQERRYIVVIETIAQQTDDEAIWIVTAFRIRDEKYLRNYDLLRSWRDGARSS